MSEMSEREHREFVHAMYQICDACAKHFGKDARAARRIAQSVLAKWGYVNPKGADGKWSEAK